VFGIILVITIVMAIWLWRKMKAIKIILLEEQEQRRRARRAAEGRDEEESIENEWSSLTNDIRNDGPRGPYDPVPPPYDPVALGPDTAPYNRSAQSSPGNNYNSRVY
jgi:hypothetical protein